MPLIIISGEEIFYNKIENLQNDFIHAQGVSKKLTEENKKLSEKSRTVDINYNNRTGELFAHVPDDVEHTCVWTIWGDHGSEFTLTTDISLISEANNPQLKSFLPPRVPIYVTCVDWNNRNYHGSIGEYE